MLSQNETLQHIIQTKLAQILEQNPHFSLRAFAKKLNVSPSHLSRVLRGQKSFSYQSSLRLIRELDLSEAQGKVILAAFDKTKAQKTENLSIIDQDERKQKILDFEIFRLIADWYHFPILELIRTKEFKSNENWIAKRLGLPVPIVSLALNRLELLELITRKDGKIKLTNGEILKTADDIQNIAIKKHHTQMLEKATAAIEEQAVTAREFQALNLNFNPEELSEAKKMIRAFCKSFNKKFSKKQGKEVYQLNLQLFSLTKDIL